MMPQHNFFESTIKYFKNKQQQWLIYVFLPLYVQNLLNAEDDF